MNDTQKDQLLAIIGEVVNIDVEIDQDLYLKPDWATHQVVRSSGLVEDICEHGIGHPNAEYLRINDPNGELGFACHGCDLCCCDEETKKKIREEIKNYHEEQEVI